MKTKLPRTQDYAAPIKRFAEEKVKKLQKREKNEKKVREIMWKHDTNSLVRPWVHATDAARQRRYYFSFWAVNSRKRVWMKNSVELTQLEQLGIDAFY